MNEHILVVEDDTPLRKSEALALRHFGFEVFEAADGAEALVIFGQHTIEAVVIDGKMPIMDGFEACERIRATHKGAGIPILMVTGMNETQAIENAYHAGATDFILKPVNLKVLSHRLHHLIEKSRLQNDLLSTRSTLETFFEAIPSAVIFCDRKWQVINANPSAEALFGWPLEFMKGLPLQALFVNQKDLSGITGALERKERVELPWELLFTTAKERPFWGEIVGARVEESGWVLVITNVTEQRRAREEREKTARLDLLGLLAGGIAHDFNNILTAICSSLSLAQMEVDQASKAAGYLYGAQPALEQAKRLSRQLLTFSKGGAPIRKICDVAKLLRQTVEFSLRGSKVMPVYEIGMDCWLASVDEGQLVQVISNLAVNALQAMPGGGKLWVGISNVSFAGESPAHLAQGNYLKITIRDDGCGMSKETLSKIFDPYFTTKATGSGLGLATVDSVIKRHQGSVGVASKIGEGTVFTIHLPAETLSARLEFKKTECIRGVPDDCGLKNHACASPLTGVTVAKKKVLLLEDQEMLRSVVVTLLKKCNCDVEAFETGESAVAAYKQNKDFDLVILDMTLPGGMSGLEALQAMRTFAPDVCAVVSTGYADDPVLAEPQKYGFRGVLPKPYSFETLKALLDGIFADSRTRSQATEQG